MSGAVPRSRGSALNKQKKSLVNLAPKISLRSREDLWRGKLRASQSINLAKPFLSKDKS